MGKKKRHTGPSPDALLQELAKRAEKPVFDIEKFCFEHQLNLIQDEADFATACCSRRSGKTLACAADLIDTAQKRAGIVCLYITLSRASAKRIIWPELMRINREFNLGGITNMADLSLTLPNRSVIYCSGAKNKTEIEKFRGLPIALCYIDEAQAFGSFIEELIDDVISKALYDYNGRLRVTGTPSPIPAGYFYDICEGTKSETWSHHYWTMLENPWLEKKSGKTPMQLIERDMKRKGVTLEDPTIQRECFGKWITDSSALVFRYDKEINSFEDLPEVKGGKWNFIVGVDIGYDDADAIAVIAYHDFLKEAYLVDEIIATKQGVTDLAKQIEGTINKYNPISIVMDVGGLGKKISEEFSRRYSLGIKPAEKSRKFEYIELLNDAMRTKRFFARQHGRFAEDTQRVEWDKDKSTGDKLVVSKQFHSDITDAVLYAFRESLHFLSETLEEKIRPGTAAWIAKQEQEMEEAALKAMESKKEDDLQSIGAKHIDWGSGE